LANTANCIKWRQSITSALAYLKVKFGYFVVFANGITTRHGVQQHLQQVATSLNAYAPGSKAVQSEVDSLNKLAKPHAMAAPAAVKEVFYAQQRRSRNQADYRQATPIPPPPETPKQTSDQGTADQNQKARRKLKFPWQS
jgi:hypothetical protein